MYLANPHLLCTCSLFERDIKSFPDCVKYVRVQALSDSVKFRRRLMQILDLLSCDLTYSKAIEQSLNDRNKITNERQVNNCDQK